MLLGGSRLRKNRKGAHLQNFTSCSAEGQLKDFLDSFWKKMQSIRLNARKILTEVPIERKCIAYECQFIIPPLHCEKGFGSPGKLMQTPMLHREPISHKFV